MRIGGYAYDAPVICSNDTLVSGVTGLKCRVFTSECPGSEVFLKLKKEYICLTSTPYSRSVHEHHIPFHSVGVEGRDLKQGFDIILSPH